MTEIFVRIINVSITASWLVLAVLLLRLVLKKAPKWVSVLLWGFVALRLLCPFSIETVMSIIPSAETISPQILVEKFEGIYSGFAVVDSTINPIISGVSTTTSTEKSGLTFVLAIKLLSRVWAICVMLLSIYTMASYWLLRRKVATAVLLKDNVFQSENVDSPFVLGIIKPKIYLPFQIDGQNLEHVIAHEESHIHRKDHWWKPFGFLLLTIHWFNPLMWLGYTLLCRDIELACDEKVIKEMDNKSKADYTQALVACSVNRRSIAACPLAFGEVGVKERVKSVMHYKKPTFWVIASAIVICIVVAVCFLTNPMDQTSLSKLNIDEVNMPGALSDVNGMVVTYEGISVTCSEQADINRFLATLDKIKVSKEPISQNRSENRSKAFSIKVNGNTELNFNERFTEFWVDNNVKPSLTHRITNPETAKELLLDFNFTNSSIGGVDGPHNITITPENLSPNDVPIDSLMEYHPEYFGLDATNGLDVYVWQMSKNSYSFGLLPHSETTRDRMSPELMELKGVSAAEMRRILATYDTAQDEIYVIPWQNPISSYIPECWVINEGDDLEAKTTAYVENIREMLFSVTSTAHDEIIVKSGENTVPMISFPAGTAYDQYADRVHWLTITSDEEAFVPFTVLQNGEEKFGGYTIFDAQTLKPLDYFHPSGLAPQTYLFRNADPTRAYIVLATFSMDPDAEIYAFGAKFDS